MLAWDIETLGVNRHKDLVTVISLYDPASREPQVLRFVDMNEEGDIVKNDDFHENVAMFVSRLDGAERLCTFNGYASHPAPPLPPTPAPAARTRTSTTRTTPH